MKLINYFKSFFTTASLSDQRRISLIVKDNYYALVDPEIGCLLDVFNNNLDAFDDKKVANKSFLKALLSYKKTLTFFVGCNICVVVDAKTEKILNVFDTKLDFFDNIKDADKAYPLASKKWKLFDYDIEEGIYCI